MNHYFRSSLFLILAFCFLACQSKSSPQKVEQSLSETTVQKTAPDEASSPIAPAPEKMQEKDEEKSVFDLFVPETQKSLSYNGYTLTKTSKNVWVKEERTDAPVAVPYSVLTRKGKTIKRFEYNDFSLTSPDFGWLNSSDNQIKHIIVGETEPRSGRYWVISLFPRYRVLFDTNDFGGSRQDIQIIDIDKDGINELKVFTYGCITIGLAYNLLCTPQPEIIFKYDKKTGKYLPANHLLEEYSLKGIAERIGRLKPTSEKPSITNSNAVEECVDFREMTEIFLDFIYAGKENQAWAFFDKYYNLPDRNQIKAYIKTGLRKDPIYRFINNVSSL